MSRLVDDLLFVARREAGEVPLSLSRVALGSILESAEHDAARLGSAAARSSVSTRMPRRARWRSRSIRAASTSC
jgi:signal transduction histidine kinase